jgi:glycosyltransferase involved in cell wall biosynthesis
MTVKVSIIMATYNMAQYIHAVIKSTLNQSFSDFEFIIVNDASNDNTVDVIKSFSDGRIVLLNNKRNLKSSKARNIAIEHARGKYIAVCDADDINMPNRLEMQSKYLDVHPEVDVVGSNYYIFNNKGDITGSIGIENERRHDDLVKNITWNMPLAHPTIMGRAEWFKKFKYRKEFARCQDYELFLRAYWTSRFAIIPEYLYVYRDMECINLRKISLGLWYQFLMIYRYRKEYSLPTGALLTLPLVFSGRLLR